ncbi:MAG: MoaD/ThiS family protein [Candidatus Rokuibacteriota bacterium]
MRIEVRLFATLISYLPPGSGGGAVILEIPTDSTVDDVAAHLGIPSDLPRIALVNGHGAGPDRHLSAGDIVTLFPPLAGG